MYFAKIEVWSDQPKFLNKSYFMSFFKNSVSSLVFFWLRIAKRSFRDLAFCGCKNRILESCADLLWFRTLFCNPEQLEPSELLDSCSEPSGLLGDPVTSFNFRLFRGRPFSFGAAIMNPVRTQVMFSSLTKIICI